MSGLGFMQSSPTRFVCAFLGRDVYFGAGGETDRPSETASCSFSASVESLGGILEARCGIRWSKSKLVSARAHSRLRPGRPKIGGISKGLIKVSLIHGSED